MLIKNIIYRNFKLSSSTRRVFTLKKEKVKKNKECDILPHVEKFFNNILKENTNNLKHVLGQHHVKKSINFLLKLFQVNEKVLKDETIRDNTVQMIYEIENKLDDKLEFINVLDVFTPLFCDFPSNDLLKDLMRSFKTKNYLFNTFDSDLILKYLNKIKNKNPNFDIKEYNEVVEKLYEENPDPNIGSKEHLKEKGLDELKNIDVSISHKKNKVTFRSRHFFPKIRLIGLDDYSYTSVYESLLYLERESPNIIVFQKPPIYEMGFHEKHIGMLDSPLLKEFNGQVLDDKSRFLLSDVEKLVWENKDNIKSPSFVYTIIYRSLFQLNKYNNIKIYLADMPLFNEIDLLIKRHNNLQETKDFFTYAKLNYLLEKYIWLTKKCKKQCPSCTGHRMEHPHYNIENVLNYQDFYIPEKYDFFAENVIKVLLSNLEEPYIYAFVDRRNLFIIAQTLAVKLEGLSDFKPIKENFQYEYGNPRTSYEENQSINQDSRELYVNKLALFSSLYVDTEKIPETKKILKEFPEFERLFSKYREKLNFVDDLKIWKSRKFDGKCFPTQLMINKFLNKK